MILQHFNQLNLQRIYLSFKNTTPFPVCKVLTIDAMNYIYIYMGESRLPLSRLPVYFCFSSPSISAYLPRLQSFISPTIASHFPDYRFLLHFPDYSVSLYTHSKDKRDFKLSCLIFLDHNFATIILCDKLFLQLKKRYFF